MTDLTWKQKRTKDGEKIKGCWVSGCGYTLARCQVGADVVYQVSAPRERAPFAHVCTRKEVVMVINIDKELRSDRD